MNGLQHYTKNDNTHLLTYRQYGEKEEDMSKVKTYIVVAKDEDGNYHTDYIQALNSQQAVDFLYSDVRDKYEVLEVALVVQNWK